MAYVTFGYINIFCKYTHTLLFLQLAQQQLPPNLDTTLVGEKLLIQALGELWCLYT